MKDRVALSVIGLASALVVVIVAVLLLGRHPETGAVPGVSVLPAVNAALNGTSAALLTAGPHGFSRLPPGFLTGVTLALGAGLSYAVYAVAVKGLVHRAPPLAVAALTFSVAALSLLPVLLVEWPAADARG